MTAMSLVKYITEKNICFIESGNNFSAIEKLALTYDGTDVCSDMQLLISSLKEREEIMSTGIGFGIAIPHAKIAQVKKISFAIGISKKGIDFNSMDGIPVKLIILVLAGEKQHNDYLGLLSKIMNMLKVDSVKEAIISAATPQEVLSIIENQT